jgi:starch synthase
MRILLAASEAAPFAKTGGLGDVCGALPRALARLGHEVALFMPYYRQVAAGAFRTQQVARMFVPLGGGRAEACVLRAEMPGSPVSVYFVARDEFFSRPGLYNSGGKDYWDNCERFAFFCRAVCEAARELELAPDVFHLNDWQTALIPPLLKFLYRDHPRLGRSATALTIHNLAYQGQFPPWKMPATGLGVEHFNWKEFEFYGHLNLMKGGLVHADVLNTVSKRYAREVQTPEGGYGLEGVLAERKADLFGIVNGIDYSVWNPATDRHIPARYTPQKLAGKAGCKRALLAELGLPADGDRPLLGMVSRLTDQKGLDILAEALPGILTMPVQFVLLGEGQDHWQWVFSELAQRHPGRMAVRIGHDERLAHRIEAASDLYLMPSRYEPCGLNQLISLKYGSVPVVRETGGLADTITDSVNGFTFSEYSATALLVAVRRALAARANRAAWKKLVLGGMTEDWSWARSAGEYVRLYALARARRGLPMPIALEAAPAARPAGKPAEAAARGGRRARPASAAKKARSTTKRG